jgi:hypothetical protein
VSNFGQKRILAQTSLHSPDVALATPGVPVDLAWTRSDSIHHLNIAAFPFSQCTDGHSISIV